MEEVPPEISKDIVKKSRHRKKHLYSQILNQMEFYFSDSNLTKDRFLSQLLAQNPNIDLEEFLKFNKIRKFNCTLDDIRKAISKSELIQLSDDGTKVSRKTPIKLKENLDECTIYVENIKPDTNHEWLNQLFSDFGSVAYVSIPKFRHNKLNKGFAFVEFDNEKGAQDSLEFFKSIGAKMSSDTSPDELQSIVTFAKDEADDDVEPVTDDESSGLKRKRSEDEEGIVDEKIKLDEEAKSQKSISESLESKKLRLDEDTKEEKQLGSDVKQEDTDKKHNDVEENDVKKKKKNKKDKKKTLIKEMGLQVLSKKEWKKLRNRYLDLQKKKMKEFKQHLYRQKFSKESYSKDESDATDSVNTKIEFIPGVVVKLKLPEPCEDVKTIKNELKIVSNDVKFVDVPLCGSDEIFVRFGSSDGAREFCNLEFPGDRVILENDEEKLYWEKLQEDRANKFAKMKKKQRGRDKLLKKAEKEKAAQHLRFEED